MIFISRRKHLIIAWNRINNVMHHIEKMRMFAGMLPAKAEHVQYEIRNSKSGNNFI